jgi:hypothetical protein
MQKSSLHAWKVHACTRAFHQEQKSTPTGPYTYVYIFSDSSRFRSIPFCDLICSRPSAERRKYQTLFDSADARLRPYPSVPHVHMSWNLDGSGSHMKFVSLYNLYMMHGCAMIRKSMPMPIKPISYFLPRSMMLDLCTPSVPQISERFWLLHSMFDHLSYLNFFYK